MIEERQFHGVGDLLDLSVEATDVAVRDSGTSSSSRSSTSGRGSFSKSMLVRGSRRIVSPLRSAPRATSRRARRHALRPASDDKGAHAIFEQFLDRHDLTRDLRMTSLDDVKLSLSTTSERGEVVVVDVGVQPDAHLAAAGQDVDRASSFLPTITP